MSLWVTGMLALCCVPLLAGVVSGSEIEESIAKVRDELGPLDLSQPQKHGKAARAFFRYYGLDVEGAEHWLGTVESGDYTIAMHMFSPPKPRGTVLIVHGYYDHAGIWKHVIRRLVDEGYQVAVYDQPGHGLSDGERASIKSFSEYVSVLEDCLAFCEKHLDGPIHLAAHSTGCSAAMDYLLTADKIRVKQVVLIAPLIRSVAWGISGLGMSLGGAKFEYVPRTFRRNSSDKAFLKFMKRDPLQTHRVPTAWIMAHRAWEERITQFTPSQKKIRVIQGTKDSTVDWEHNLPVIKTLFPNVDTRKLEGGGHQLINESEKLRTKTLNLISGWLRGNQGISVER